MSELIHQDGQAEIECHFCHTKYLFTKEELIEINKKRKEK
jgi:molecular chaperone Hsp33